MGKELELQGPVKLASKPEETPQVAPNVPSTAVVPVVGKLANGNRGEVIERADKHFLITNYADGTIRKDNLAPIK